MPDVAINVGNLIRRELRRRVGFVAKTESQVRRYTGKGLNNIKLPKNAKLPAGFKVPKGMKLIVPEGSVVTPGDETAPEIEDADAKGSSTTLVIIVVVALLVPLLIVAGFIAVPRALDWWDGRNATETGVATTTVPATTVPVTTTVAPVVVLEWAVGSCVTTGDDGFVRPSTCDAADLTVTESLPHGDDPLTAAEISEIQQVLVGLGIELTVDGAIGRQTQTAIDAVTVGAGIPTDVAERAKLAVVRGLALPGGLDDDGPRTVRTEPALCGDGISWVETPSEVLCLAAR
jgi:hypothetical protein